MPDAPPEHPYSLTLSLNVLNHLGINLYSNVPAVLAEVVANSWDADAENVDIDVDPQGGCVRITDDGHGMDREDVNNKYLNVGFQRRAQKDGAVTPKWGRPVMGRKGIGKLSLFSVARLIEVHTVEDGNRNAFRMVLADIEEKIKAGGEGTYYPDPLPPEVVDLEKGTRVVLTDLKKTIYQAEAALRKRLARRFSIIGDRYRFNVRINGRAIGVADREYFNKLQYVWWYGNGRAEYAGMCPRLEHSEERPNCINGSENRVSGWIGTVAESGSLQDEDENLNKITVLVRGKLAQEDILEAFTEGGMYTKYLMGEIEADFLDLDDREDIATTSRQRIIEDDPRYQELKALIHRELKHIQSQWTELRNRQGAQKAQEIPAIREWLDGLKGDTRRRAERLFGRINQIALEREEDRRRLFAHGVLAFESLRYKENLDALEQISTENLQALVQVFTNLDDIEASLYHQIAKERVQVIRTLREKVEESAREKAIQQHLFDHLWLLDPSWERAATSEYMESTLQKEFEQIDAGLSEEERAGRVDIKYRTATGKHIIVELKKADRVLSTPVLQNQVMKYWSAMRKLLAAMGRANEPIEIVCVVGRELSDWQTPDGREASERALSAYNARVIMYQGLIDRAYQAYQEYMERNAEAGRLSRLISQIETWDDEVKSGSSIAQPRSRPSAE